VTSSISNYNSLIDYIDLDEALQSDDLQTASNNCINEESSNDMATTFTAPSLCSYEIDISDSDDDDTLDNSTISEASLSSKHPSENDNSQDQAHNQDIPLKSF
jgi:hypothetical protein